MQTIHCIFILVQYLILVNCQNKFYPTVTQVQQCSEFNITNCKWCNNQICTYRCNNYGPYVYKCICDKDHCGDNCRYEYRSKDDIIDCVKKVFCNYDFSKSPATRGLLITAIIFFVIFIICLTIVLTVPTNHADKTGSIFITVLILVIAIAISIAFGVCYKITLDDAHNLNNESYECIFVF
jgi:hypothetical protein